MVVVVVVVVVTVRRFAAWKSVVFYRTMARGTDALSDRNKIVISRHFNRVKPIQ